MYQDYPGNYDTSSRGSSTSPAQPESFTSGSSTIGSPISTSSYQKYRVDMPGSNSAFIPTINAITTSQDLQWMVQPTVITSMSNPYSRSHPYGHHLTNGPGLLAHNSLPRPGVIRSIGDARGRRKRDEQVWTNLTPEEEEKRRVRRERNKLAAAKCRNRRRELTEMLQGETEKLEEEKADLQKEIENLQKEKDKLEFMLVAHNPVCKLPLEERHQAGGHPQCAALPLALRPRVHMTQVVVKQEPEDAVDEAGGKPQRSVIKPICLGGGRRRERRDVLPRRRQPQHAGGGGVHPGGHAQRAQPHLHLPQHAGAREPLALLRVLLQGPPALQQQRGPAPRPPQPPPPPGALGRGGGGGGGTGQTLWRSRL
ncbi:unnamed protein product [Menidia menidia]|uniref:(Atlantic silverside) hypothetical protein n=1 Tax=Menidia menidia TaxID=238744 RepID=A0A8S4AJ04_9TELE|nr:unnamed protein product [Menidia menidia]